jgi:hypothetical protein
VLMLPRSAPLRCSKRKDSASIFGQTRRADHNLTHAFAVFVDAIRESQPCYPAKPAKQSTGSLAYDAPIIRIFSDRVTALLGDLTVFFGRAEIFMVGEQQD